MLSVITLIESKTYSQAIKHECWKEAMLSEIQALQQNNTWELIDLSRSKTSIRCKWIYEVKLKADRFLERYKSRLVAKGYTHTEGIDYFNTFSPLVKMTTVSLFGFSIHTALVSSSMRCKKFLLIWRSTKRGIYDSATRISHFKT